MFRIALTGLALLPLAACSENQTISADCEMELQLERPTGEVVEIVEAERLAWSDFKIRIASTVISQSEPFAQTRSVADSEDGFVQFKPGQHYLVRSRISGGSGERWAFENACSVQDGQCSCFELRRAPVADTEV